MRLENGSIVLLKESRFKITGCNCRLRQSHTFWKDFIIRNETESSHVIVVGRRSERAVMKGIRMAGQYTPVENYLRDLPESQREVTLGFVQIERILNSKLPASAYKYWDWWANEKEGNHVNGRVWVNAGWKVESVDFDRKQARLVRV